MYELEYIKYILRRYIKNEKGVTILEWLFVLSAVLTVALLLFGKPHKPSWGAAMYWKMIAVFKKIK